MEGQPMAAPKRRIKKENMDDIRSLMVGHHF